MNHLVFISHSSSDLEFCISLYEKLQAKGVKCWLDRRELDNDAKQSIDFPEAIAEAIENSTILVAVLSNASASSSFVRKELYFAFNEKIPCHPIQIDTRIENASVRLMFSDTNIIDAFTPPIDERVDRFVDMITEAIGEILADEELPLAKQTKLKLLDLDATDAELEAAKKFIESHSPRELNRLFRSCRKMLEGAYKDLEDPYEVYHVYNTYESSSCKVKVVADLAESAGRFSNDLGRLFEFISYFLINSGEIGYVHEARRFLRRTLRVYESIDDTAETARRTIHAKWLLSITYKQEQNYGKALSILDELLPFAQEERDEFDLTYAESVLLPMREIAIVRGDDDAFDQLIKDERLYSDDVREHFFTLRRCFEHYCYNYEIEKAASIKNRLEESFELAKDELEPVYYYAMMFDMFFFRWGSKDIDGAEELYEWLHPELTTRHFVRYANALERAHKDMVSGKRIKDGKAYRS